MEVIMPVRRQMTYLGEDRVCLGDQGWGKTIQINYKINFIQNSCLTQTLYILDSQSANFKIFECSSEVHQIHFVIYENTSHFTFKVCIDLQYNDA